MSGNVISAASGIFYQDYWYNRSCTTCLDEHNGHDMQDGRGYHYHVTVRQNPAGGRLIPTFPYTFGPTYAGQLQPAVTYTPTGTPTTAVATSTPTFTATPSSTSTSTASPTPVRLLTGHVVWQGAPAQPNIKQQQPVTLTLTSGTTQFEYPARTTDASGVFTVDVSNR